MVACYRIERYDRSNGYGCTCFNYYLHYYRNYKRVQQYGKRNHHG